MSEKRYSRIERYAGLADVLPRWRESCAAVVGLGGLGGGLVQHLARFGVRRLVLIDRDIVGWENLGHQQLYTAGHAEEGWPKAAAAAETARAINPDVAVVYHIDNADRRNIRELLDGVELIFDGLDNYFGRYLLNDYAHETAQPYFYAGVVRGELSTRAIIPGSTGCLRCLLPDPPAPGDVPTCAAEGVFPPLLGIANALQLDAASRYLAGDWHRQDDRLFSLTADNWRLRQIQLEGPQAACPCCGQGRYEFLDGTRDALATAACHGASFSLELPGKLADMDQVAAQLVAGGDFVIRRNRYCLVAEHQGLRYTLFGNGKIVLEGSTDSQVLQHFVATYLGI